MTLIIPSLIVLLLIAGLVSALCWLAERRGNAEMPVGESGMDDIDREFYVEGAGDA